MNAILNVLTSNSIDIIVIIIALLILVSVVIVVVSIENNPKELDELVKNNTFLIENAAKINEKMDNYYQSTMYLRIGLVLSLLAVVLCFLFFAMTNGHRPIELVPVVIAGIIAIIIMVRYRRLSDIKYNEIVSSVLHDYDQDLIYYPYEGFSFGEYKTCLFPEWCDKFSSEDMIVNVKKCFCYSDIIVESEHEDSEGNTHYSVEFKGSLARIDIENVNCRIFLGSTHKKYIFNNDGLISVNFENEEFNNLFCACTDNELAAYKILTPDIMEQFVKIKKNTYGNIDIRILNDKLYIRFLSGDKFDNVLFGEKMEKKDLIQSIAFLEEVIKTMDKIKTIINDKNVE